MVAEAIPETPVEESQQEPVAPSTEPEAVATEGGVQAATEAKAEGTEESEPEFDAESLPEWKAAIKPSEPAPPVLPGNPVEKVREEQMRVRASNYAYLMQQGESAIYQAVQKAGYDDDVALTAARAAMPYLNALHANNEDFNLTMENAAIEAALEADEVESYRKNAYSNRTDAIKAARLLGIQKKDAEWKARVEKGEYVSRADAKKIADAAFVKGRAAGEKAQSGARSGNVANGAVPSNPGKEDEMLMDPRTPIETVNAILARRSGQ